MPLIDIKTNKKLEAQPNADELISIIAEILNKPVERIFVSWDDSANLAFGKGNPEPALLCTLHTIDRFNPDTNKKVDAAILPWLEKRFNIKRERIVTRFGEIDHGFALMHF